MRKNTLYLFLLVISMSSCMPRIQENGFFKTDGEAETLVSREVDLDEHKALLVVPKRYVYLYEKIDYFDEVISREDFEREVQKQGAAYRDLELSSATAKSVYIEYRPFLYLVHREKYGFKNLQVTYLELVHPRTSEVIFRARSSSQDKAELNELIKYIRANSQTYWKS